MRSEGLSRCRFKEEEEEEERQIVSSGDSRIKRVCDQSVITLALTSLAQNKVGIYSFIIYRLFLDFNSWILEKTVV